MTNHESKELRSHLVAGVLIALVLPLEEAVHGGAHLDLTQVEEVDQVVLELDKLLHGCLRGTQIVFELSGDVQRAGYRAHRGRQSAMGAGAIAGGHLLGVETGGLLHTHLEIFIYIIIILNSQLLGPI